MKVLPILAAVALLAGGGFASAQEICDPATSTSVQQIATNVVDLCCSKNAKVQTKCLNRSTALLRKATGSIGDTVISEAIAEIGKIKDASCGATDIPECTEENSVTLDQLGENADLSCCGNKNRAARTKCFNVLGTHLNRAGKQLGGAFVKRQALARINSARKNDCGNPPPVNKSKCQITKKNTDGREGWLHKPVSDSTRSIVNLFPKQDSPSECRYETKKGKLIRDAYSSGRHNGFRVHIRPAGGGSCSSFPKDMVLRCKIANKQVCYQIPNACNRYD